MVVDQLGIALPKQGAIAGNTTHPVAFMHIGKQRTVRQHLGKIAGIWIRLVLAQIPSFHHRIVAQIHQNRAVLRTERMQCKNVLR
ncbi:MAG: Uncharacterised protein [Cryomorphaceae bacterium]|nr:MAG: Uncharacterised protein [Cryomorphaceae bacterium]